MQKRRYPGVSPFTSDQQNIFFGRDNDIKKLYKLISMRNQVLLYSKSGIGKTSLLNAGVLPKLEKENTIIRIRFFAHDENNSISPTEKSLRALQNTITEQKSEILEELVKDVDYQKTLWYYFKQLQFAGKTKFILVFDQFEELFSYPEDQINQFKNELHELTDIDIPNEIKQKLAEADELDDDLIDVLYEDLEIKTVFAIRSDRLSLLNQLTDKIPDIQETFYELKPLDNEQTKRAVIQPALSDLDFETKPFKYDKSSIEKIINALTDNGKQNVETTQLQIVCQKIEDIAQKKHTETLESDLPVIKTDDLPEFKDIFLSFYDDTINSVCNTEKDKNLTRKFVEDQLIRNNQRISLDEIICLDYVTKNVLQKLVNKHLLRAEKNSTGGFSYELSHDTLIEPISVSRKERVLKEQAEKERIKREKEKIERKKERKRQRTIILIVSIAALISIGFAIFGFLQMQNAISQQKETLRLTTEGYFKDAKALTLDEEFQKAIQKYVFLRDTILHGDSVNVINPLIEECEKLDSVKTIFDGNLKLCNSLLFDDTNDDNLKIVDSLIKETEKLNYTYGKIRLDALSEKTQMLIEIQIDQYLESMKQLPTGSDIYLSVLEQALKLDADNTKLDKYK